MEPSVILQDVLYVWNPPYKKKYLTTNPIGFLYGITGFILDSLTFSVILRCCLWVLCSPCHMKWCLPPFCVKHYINNEVHSLTPNAHAQVNTFNPCKVLPLPPFSLSFRVSFLLPFTRSECQYNSHFTRQLPPINEVNKSISVSIKTLDSCPT